MLYLIGTYPDGEVASVYPCENGIDEAITKIASALSHPEEDWMIIAEGISDQWNEDPRYNQTFTRKGFLIRYGLGVFPKED